MGLFVLLDNDLNNHKARLNWCAQAALLLVLSLSGPATAEPATIVAGGGDGYEPFHFVQGDTAGGFDVDLLRAVAAAMNMDLALRLDHWSLVRAGLESGEVQVHLGMTHSAERSARYAFTTPTLNQQHRIFVRAGERGIDEEGDLPGKRIAVQRGGVMAAYAVEHGYTKRPLLVDGAREALALLRSGGADCVLMSELRGLHVLHELGIDDVVRVGDPMLPTSYGFAVAHDRRDILLRLNQGLALVKATGQYDRIYDRWFGLLAPAGPANGDYLKIALWVTTPLLVGLLLVALWSRSLRRQVIKRTAELAEARDLAESGCRAKTQFLATVSHELRTPLNGILGMAQLLRETRLDAEQTEQAELIDQSAHVLKAIVSDMLEFATICEGGRAPVRVAFSPRVLMGAVLAAAAPAARARGLQLGCDLAADLPERLIGDSTALERVMQILLGNAIKFTPRGSIELRAAWSRDGDGRIELRAAVADTGVGVDPAVRARLFEAFTQGDGSLTREHGGTGLGLAICRDLVADMNGHIDVAPGPRGGSVFTVTVTMLEAPSVAASTAEVAAPPVRAAAADTVLIAEDNPINQRVMTLMLDGWGMAWELAADGSEAVEACRRKRFAVVLMDRQMPVMDGLAAAEAIREFESPDERTPIIALTAGSCAEDRERCLAAGMDAYLAKPIDGPALRATLEERLAAAPVGAS